MSNNEPKRINQAQQMQARQAETIQERVIAGTPPVNNNGNQTKETHQPLTPVGTEIDRKFATSSAKVAANRKNALKSTGPTTPQGKRRVAQNAVRHGFFSQCLLVKHPDGKEDEGEYAAFYAALRKHYEPMDWLEELWVEKIAVWSWRLRRLIRCESGQISKALADHGYEIQQSKAADSENSGIAPLANPEMDAMTDHLFLPSNEDLERLLRYEAMISRQLNHAIAELERLQARRLHGSTAGQVS